MVSVFFLASVFAHVLIEIQYCVSLYFLSFCDFILFACFTDVLAFQMFVCYFHCFFVFHSSYDVLSFSIKAFVCGFSSCSIVVGCVPDILCVCFSKFS